LRLSRLLYAIPFNALDLDSYNTGSPSDSEMPEIRTQVERLATLMAESMVPSMLKPVYPNYTYSSRQTICFNTPSHVEAI
jgi:hypothetical protein